MGKFFKKKIVFSPHGMLDDFSFRRKKIKKTIAFFLYQKHIIKKSNLIIVNSDKEKKTFAKLNFKKKIIVINHGIKIRKDFVKSFQNLSFVYFSKIHPIKNLHKLIQFWLASSILRKKKLDIFGSIDDKKYYLKIKKLIKFKKNINYKGKISGEKKFNILSKYNVLIHPSLSENFGLVILEALSCGLYIIYNNELPWKILDKNGYGRGIRFNLTQLEKEIMQLERNKSQMKVGNRKKSIFNFIKKNYNWNIILEQYYIQYAKLFSKNQIIL